MISDAKTLLNLHKVHKIGGIPDFIKNVKIDFFS